MQWVVCGRAVGILRACSGAFCVLHWGDALHAPDVDGCASSNLRAEFVIQGVFPWAGSGGASVERLRPKGEHAARSDRQAFRDGGIALVGVIEEFALGWA